MEPAEGATRHPRSEDHALPSIRPPAWETPGQRPDLDKCTLHGSIEGTSSAVSFTSTGGRVTPTVVLEPTRLGADSHDTTGRGRHPSRAG
jgi:hypothetical protein